MNQPIRLPGESLAPLPFEPSGGLPPARINAHRWLTLSIFGFLILLAGVAVYLFTGQSVQITFDPRTTQVEVDGGLFEFKLGERWLLHSGDYTVTAALEGYHPFSETITVSNQPQQEFLFSLERLPGYLNVSTDPVAPAEIRLDARSLGPAPLSRHELAPGTYQLEVLAERYQPVELTLEVPGGGTDQDIVIELDPAWSEVSLSSNPPGANLWVDEVNVGPTPLTAEILMGARQVELRLPGYKTWNQELLVPNNEPMVIPEVALVQADNLVRLVSRPSRASVTVDGDYRGETPLELELPPGREYRFRFSKAGFQSARRSLNINRGEEANLDVSLVPILGQVNVTGSPADAVVYVDGVRRGLINERFELPARPHIIEVRREGFRPFGTTVTPNPDLEQQVPANLKSLAEIEAERTPQILTAAAGNQLKLFRPNGMISLGSTRREQGRRANEMQRQVRLQRPFYMGINEVTNQQFMAWRANHDSGVVQDQTLALPDQPVVRISWEDAARYCNWLSQRASLPAAYVEQDGLMVPVSPMNTGFRLPTEAEWTLVARYQGIAGNSAARKYPWGSSLPPPGDAGNYAGTEAQQLVSSVISNFTDEFPATAPVGHYPENNAGLNDLGGNVREWIHDFYSVTTGQGTPVDPTGPANGSAYVVRGASWRSGLLTDLRLAWRDQGTQAKDDIGFRVARYAE